jgi:hypothetical protein
MDIDFRFELTAPCKRRIGVFMRNPEPETENDF